MDRPKGRHFMEKFQLDEEVRGMQLRKSPNSSAVGDEAESGGSKDLPRQV